MKYFLLVIFNFVFTVFIAFPISIKGIVKDLETGEEIIGAGIYINGDQSKRVISGLDGSFVLHNITRFPVIITCSYVGYHTKEIILKTPENNLIIELYPKEMYMDEVVVYANQSQNTENNARDIERRSMNVLNIVSGRAIEISPDLTVANVIQRVSGVTIERNSSGDGQYAILRGMDKRYNYTLVNGVKIPSPDNKNRFVPLDIFPSEMLERLEVTKALTADMEADGIGGAVNLIMKDAPTGRQLTFNVASGYNTLFFERSFLYFDHAAINKQAPSEIHKGEEKFKADISDFTNKNLRLESKTAPPNLLFGMSFGDRFFGNKLGLMLAGNYQNSYRGSNSLLYGINSTSDLLPLLSSEARREYSEQQSRMGSHLKLDYRINKSSKLQWYNGYMYLSSIQVRDNTSIPLLYGYAPEQNSYNMSFGTRLRINNQSIFNSTLK